MANGEYESTRVMVIGDVSIVYGSTPNGEQFLAIQDFGNDDPGSVGFSPAELPALIARLQQVAEAMGVVTAQGKLVKFAEAFKAFISRDDYAFMHNSEFTQRMNILAEQADKALASVKQ